MDDQPRSPRFRALFESALQDYEKNAGVKLTEHPLAMQLHNCESIQSITTIFQSQVLAFSEFQGRDRVIESINNTVSILSTISATASLSDAIGLVRDRALMPCSTALTVFYSRSHLRKWYSLALRYYLLYVPHFNSYIDIFVTFKPIRRPTAQLPAMPPSSNCSSRSNIF